MYAILYMYVYVELKKRCGKSRAWRGNERNKLDTKLRIMQMVWISSYNALIWQWKWSNISSWTNWQCWGVYTL